jgi:hypothetical protein
MPERTQDGLENRTGRISAAAVTDHCWKIDEIVALLG